MFTIYHRLLANIKTNCHVDFNTNANTHFNNNNAESATPQVLKIGAKSICILLLGSVLLLTGCGQKGNLSLVDSSSQTVTNSAKVPDSNAYPQDVAFATIDDDDPNNY